MSHLEQTDLMLLSELLEVGQFLGKVDTRLEIGSDRIGQRLPELTAVLRGKEGLR